MSAEASDPPHPAAARPTPDRVRARLSPPRGEVERASPAACRIRAKGVSGMARISVAMMTHNETAEFRWLMEALVPALDVIDEIVIVDDFSGAEFTAAVRAFEGTRPLRCCHRGLRSAFGATTDHMKSALP